VPSSKNAFLREARFHQSSAFSSSQNVQQSQEGNLKHPSLSCSLSGTSCCLIHHALAPPALFSSSWASTSQPRSIGATEWVTWTPLCSESARICCLPHSTGTLTNCRRIGTPRAAPVPSSPPLAQGVDEQPMEDHERTLASGLCVDYVCSFPGPRLFLLPRYQSHPVLSWSYS
jgi:hypothetical protein